MRLPCLAAAVAVAAALSTALPSPAAAEPGAHGVYAEAGMGAAGFIGRKARNTAVGPALGVRLGWDLFTWFAVGGRLSTHEAKVPPPPDQEYFQLYHAHANGPLNVHLWRLEVHAGGGAGLAVQSRPTSSRRPAPSIPASASP